MIAESADTLKSLMKKTKNGAKLCKVQTLYLLKIQAAETVRYLAVILGRLRTAHDAEIIRHPCPPESTIHHWLQLYRTGGLEKLLEEPPKTGRPKKLEIETVAPMQK